MKYPLQQRHSQPSESLTGSAVSSGPLEKANAPASEAVTEVDSGEVGEVEPGEARETTHTSD